MATSLGRRPRRVRWLWGLVGLLLLLIVGRALTIQPRMEREYTRARPVVLAHQGASGHAPSNTLEAFRLALEQGADILELDVHLTRDGVVVVSHDETIDRMSNGSGEIRSMSLAELRQYDFGYRFTPDKGQSYPYRGKGVTIPTLEEVFQAFPGVPVNIEIKQEEPAMEAQVWELIQRYQMEERTMIAAFPSGPMKRWKALAGERVASSPPVSHMYGFTALYLTRLDRLYAPQYDAFQVPVEQSAGPITMKFATPRFIALANRLNMVVHFWTINDEGEMRRLFELGAHGVITDYPDRAVKVLKEMGLR